MTAIEFNYQLENLSGTLRPYALKLTRDTEEAKDLLQETLLKAFSNREKYSDGTNLKAWMYTIMKNTFITNYQRMMRRKTFIDVTENLHFINHGTRVEGEDETSFKMNDIQQAIDSLSDIFRIPFTMYFKGFKYHEIADDLDIPIGTVKNRIHIARKELKDRLRIYQTI